MINSLGEGFSNCGQQGRSHKATWRQLNDTHTVPRAGRYTKNNYKLRYCSVRFANRKGRDLKRRVLKCGRAQVNSEGLTATVHY